MDEGEDSRPGVVLELFRASHPGLDDDVLQERIRRMADRPLHLYNLRTPSPSVPPPPSFGSCRSGGSSASAPARERRRARTKALDGARMRYCDMVGLHSLWLQYIGGLLRDSAHDAAATAALLMKADLHGSLVHVVESDAPDRVGIAGLLVVETMQILMLLGEDDRLRRVPKAGSVFQFDVPPVGMRVTILGSQFVVRSADRTTRRFKNIT